MGHKFQYEIDGETFDSEFDDSDEAYCDECLEFTNHSDDDRCLVCGWQAS